MHELLCGWLIEVCAKLSDVVKGERCIATNVAYMLRHCHILVENNTQICSIKLLIMHQFVIAFGMARYWFYYSKERELVITIMSTPIGVGWVCVCVILKIY